jgi:chemotaxis signal transduction protein
MTRGCATFSPVATLRVCIGSEAIVCITERARAIVGTLIASAREACAIPEKKIDEVSEKNGATLAASTSLDVCGSVVLTGKKESKNPMCRF